MLTNLTEQDARLLATAEYGIMKKFREFAETVKDTDREWYFDPRNRDEYRRAFADWLSKPPEFASND